MTKVRTISPRVAAIDTRAAKPPPKRVDPFYLSDEHRRWRDEVISRAGGRCQDPQCKMPHRTGMRLFADHVVEVKDGGAKYELRNGLARCGSCHTRKTAEERARRQTAAD